MTKAARDEPSKPTPGTIDDISNVELVLLATYLLGGVLRTIDTEDIAMKAHQIAPLRFGWRKYPGQVDIERVRVRLSQAKHESMLSGVHSKGWRLTAEGARHVEDSLLSLTSNGSAKASVRKADRQWISTERKRLLGSSAYKKHQSGRSSEISKVDIQDFFRIDEYMARETRKIKLDRLASAFRSDKLLGDLLQELIRKMEIGS